MLVSSWLFSSRWTYSSRELRDYWHLHSKKEMCVNWPCMCYVISNTSIYGLSQVICRPYYGGVWWSWLKFRPMGEDRLFEFWTSFSVISWRRHTMDGKTGILIASYEMLCVVALTYKVKPSPKIILDGITQTHTHTYIYIYTVLKCPLPLLC